ncbi:restriction endonuclease subunit S [Achromobacter mucicolens]|uniref:restriction endonuclease subunit S n=1 Tax=Achromobacter mucicolens TaxID=1389922 RepID=UPI002FE391C4
MEVKPGYKQTEVGVIPEDWHMTLLDSLAKRGSGHTPSKRYPEYWNGSVKWISLADSQNLDQGYINDTFATITQLGIANSSAVIYPPETVVLSRDAGVGKSAIMGREMAVSQHFIAWTCGAGLSNQFLYHTLQARKAEFERIANGSTIKTIGLPYFQDLLILTPPIEEQHAIATTLSDMDALLDGLDRLIAKKRAIKQAAMQQLLTGKTRLPGLSGAWKIKRLGDLGATYGGLVGKNKSDFGTGSAKYVPFINVVANVQIDCTAFDAVNVEATENQNKVAKGDLFFNGSSETPEEVALCSFMAKEVKNLYLNSFCFGLRVKNPEMIDGLFLAYYIRSPIGRDLMKSLAQGSTRYNLSKRALLEAQLPLPEKEEQTAIATALSDMDAEITALETRRTKTRALKQAMRQELLTGRTRLV